MKTIVEILLDTVRTCGDRALLKTADRDYSYRQFALRAQRIAREMLAHGFQRGDRVCLLLDAYDDCFAAMFGIWLVGGVVVPLNTTLPDKSVASLIAQSGAGLLITSNETSLDTGLTRVLKVPSELDREPDESLPAIHGPDEIAMIMFTSGTTGTPKGVCQTMSAITTNATTVSAYKGITQEDRIFINTPPFFTSAICHFLTLLSVRGSMFATQGFYFGATLLEEMQREGCTGFGGAPAHLVRVVEPLDSPQHVSGLRFWVSSGDHLPVHVIEKARVLLPDVTLFNMYGLTEVSGRLCIQPPDTLANKAGSVGKPIDGMHITMRDSESLAELPAGEVGEVFVDGPCLMKGYLDMPEINARSLTEFGFSTGDFGYKDQDGFLFLEGRKDDIFKLGGEKVSALRIQQALMGLEWFEEAVVIAAEDRIMGKAPVAFVVVKPGATYKRVQVSKTLRRELPATWMPREIIPVESIPRTGSGKPMRQKLRSMLDSPR